MTDGLVSGKVAQILSERELVINIGTSHGVKKQMLFAVLATTNPIEVIDPDTNEPLGTIEQEKIRVEAVTVEEKYTICRTRSFRTPGGVFYNFTRTGFEQPSVVHESLSAQSEDYPEPLAPEDSFVKRGDKVVEIPKASPLETHS